MGGDGNCLYARGEAVAVEHERVEAGLALDLVTAIAVVPDERIVAGAEGRHVVAFAAHDRVVAVAAIEDVVARAAGQHVVAVAAEQMCGGQRLPCGRRYVVERDRVVAVPAEHVDFVGVGEWVSLNGYRSAVDENLLNLTGRRVAGARDRDGVVAVISGY